MCGREPLEREMQRPIFLGPDEREIYRAYHPRADRENICDALNVAGEGIEDTARDYSNNGPDSSEDSGVNGSPFPYLRGFPTCSI